MCSEVLSGCHKDQVDIWEVWMRWRHYVMQGTLHARVVLLAMDSGEKSACNNLSLELCLLNIF